MNIWQRYKTPLDRVVTSMAAISSSTGFPVGGFPADGFPGEVVGLGGGGARG